MRAIRTLKVGEQSPEVPFYIKKGAKFEKHFSNQFFAGKRVLVLGVPGAFWTDYPSPMVSGYDYHFQSFAELGIQDIFVTTTNDTYVLNSWFNSLEVKNLKALPDSNGDWAESVGLYIDMRDEGMGFRSHRYAMILEDGVLKKLFYEDLTHDPHTCFTETNAEKVLSFIKENQDTWYRFSSVQNLDG